MSWKRGLCLLIEFFVLLATCTVSAHAATYVTAAVNWSNDKVQIFLSDGSYLRFDKRDNRVDPGYPKRINDENWPGVGRYANQISAAVNGPPGKIYFFLANGDYLRYDTSADRVDPDYPKPVTDKTWPGMGRYGKQLLGALNWKDNKIQFFLNNGTYLRYDLTTDRVDEGYPKPISNETWPGLVPYAGQIGGGIKWDQNKAYIFLDNASYLRYDIPGDRVDAGYPKPINDANWPGMGALFGRAAGTGAPLPATVRIGSELKRTSGTVTAQEVGDTACYLSLRDETGKAFTEMAEFEICERQPRITGKKVILGYTEAKVPDESCQGDPNCRKSRKVALVNSVSIVAPGR